ncbi:MAG: hypothetical protein RBT69_06280 [Spirochaetia bacterium]|jgi:hypothetical protein|nr:hypothetical protein [Spirochaetia bacterium]
MTIFSILIFPLASLWLISGEPEAERFKQLWSDFRDYFLPGLFYFIPAPFIVNLLTGFLNRTYSLANIYLFHFFTDFFYYQLILTAFCLFKFRNMMYSGTDEKIKHYFLFFSGFFTALAVYSNFSSSSYGDFYSYFILPVSWFLMAGFTVFFMVYKDMESGIVKGLYISGLFLFPAAASLIPFFFYIRLYFLSGFILLLIGLTGYFLLRANRIEL